MQKQTATPYEVLAVVALAVPDEPTIQKLALSPLYGDRSHQPDAEPERVLIVLFPAA